jgi:DNA primase
MSKGQWVDFREVKEKVSMEMVLAHYGLLETLTQGSKGLRGPCPVHKGSHHNQFHVDLVKNRWNCFGGCDMQKLEGHVIGFVAAMENVSLRDAALLLAQWFNLSTERPEKESAPPAARRKKKKDSNQPAQPKQPTPAAPAASEEEPENQPLKFQLARLETAHPFFLDRGILPETVAHFGLGLCSRGMMKDRIVWPLERPDGVLIGYTGRTVNEVTEENPKWLLPPGIIKPKLLLNAHRVIGQFRTVIIVEGPWDLAAVHQAGFPNVISTLGRDILTDETLSYDQLRLITSNFDQAVLLYDGDKDGIEGMQRNLPKLAQALYTRMIILPDEKDPAQFPPTELQTFLSFLK